MRIAEVALKLCTVHFESIRNICLKIRKVGRISRVHFLSFAQLNGNGGWVSSPVSDEMEIPNNLPFCFAFVPCVRGRSVTRVLLTYQMHSWRWHFSVRSIKCNERFVCDRSVWEWRRCWELLYRFVLMAAMEFAWIKNRRKKKRKWCCDEDGGESTNDDAKQKYYSEKRNAECDGVWRCGWGEKYTVMKMHKLKCATNCAEDVHIGVESTTDCSSDSKWKRTTTSRYDINS